MNNNLASQGRKEKTLKRYSDFHSLFKYVTQSISAQVQSTP